jgi:hypothetical protein
MHTIASGIKEIVLFGFHPELPEPQVTDIGRNRLLRAEPLPRRRQFGEARRPTGQTPCAETRHGVMLSMVFDRVFERSSRCIVAPHNRLG